MFIKTSINKYLESLGRKLTLPSTISELPKIPRTRDFQACAVWIKQILIFESKVRSVKIKDIITSDRGWIRVLKIMADI